MVGRRVRKEDQSAEGAKGYTRYQRRAQMSNTLGGRRARVISRSSRYTYVQHSGSSFRSSDLRANCDVLRAGLTGMYATTLPSLQAFGDIDDRQNRLRKSGEGWETKPSQWEADTSFLSNYLGTGGDEKR